VIGCPLLSSLHELRIQVELTEKVDDQCYGSTPNYWVHLVLLIWNLSRYCECVQLPSCYGPQVLKH